MAKKKNAKKKAKSKRIRVGKEQTKRQMAQHGGGGNWLKLPDGIEEWTPEKKGSYVLNVVPYEVTTEDHPEEGIEAGVLWFRSEFRIHHGIGTKSQSIVCPRSVGKKCIICNEADRLRKDDKEANKEAIQAFNGQKYVMMNIINPDDSDKISVFAMSYGKFDKILRAELQEEENEENLDFYQCDEGGKTLKVRFSDATFSGNKYIEATRINFKDREDLDEEEILSKVADLDTILNVLPEEKIESIFLECEDDDDNDDENPKHSKKLKNKIKKKKVEKKEEDEDEDDDEEDSWMDKGMKKDEDEDEDEDEDDDEEEDEDEDEDEDDDEDEDEEEKKVTPKKAKKESKKKTEKKEEEEEEEDEEEEDDDDDDDWENDDEEEEDDDDDEDWDDEDDDEEEEEEEEEEDAEFEIPEGHIECKACSENDVPGENSKGGECKPCKGKGYVKDKAKKEKAGKRARKKK